MGTCTCMSYASNVLRDVNFNEGLVTMLVRIQIGQKKHFSKIVQLHVHTMYIHVCTTGHNYRAHYKGNGLIRFSGKQEILLGMGDIGNFDIDYDLKHL